ncbi:hypothetical protein IQ260_08985 [Leptolyngbya cf. ectocarpi LEGE 11479]|uniref:Uncharacterized protein n=1 Tax=Leptolyngbya cf. ectocarpi LEGE 11479 TaxID=1828722 RepID=A0A928X2W8_LEPEC|nr:hypothetical protein [Leptolyngbya ectocarpi]MBE9066786.1 hypothetical protein [Leptolyngbya cf. ectocarpi LEGE 11479]
MQTTYRLNASELNQDFLEGLKATFQNQEIEILVYTVDETDYLLKSPANRERLLTAKNNIEAGNNRISIQLEELE